MWCWRVPPFPSAGRVVAEAETSLSDLARGPRAPRGQATPTGRFLGSRVGPGAGSQGSSRPFSSICAFFLHRILKRTRLFYFCVKTARPEPPFLQKVMDLPLSWARTPERGPGWGFPPGGRERGRGFHSFFAFSCVARIPWKLYRFHQNGQAVVLRQTGSSQTPQHEARPGRKKPVSAPVARGRLWVPGHRPAGVLFCVFPACFPCCSPLAGADVTFQMAGGDGVSRIKREKGTKAEEAAQLGPGQPAVRGGEPRGEVPPLS